MTFKKNKKTDNVDTIDEMKKCIDNNTEVGIIGKDVARFEKISFEQYKKDIESLYELAYPDQCIDTDVLIKELYDKIKLPERSTTGSAGYDFFCPFGFTLDEGESIVIPTGIKAYINPNYFLMCTPRSGHGFKNHILLANTVGIIDADYAVAENEGHIMIKLIYDGFNIADHRLVPMNFNNKDNEQHKFIVRLKEEKHGKFIFEEDKAFCQGIFLQYGLANEVIASVKPKGRINGFGSTDNK